MENVVKVKQWEWKQSKTKTAKEIMLANQSLEYNEVASMIAAATNLSIIEARALYRRVSPELAANGFVPAVVRRGRPRKFGLALDTAAAAADVTAVVEATAAPVTEAIAEPVERTENGERASIAEMREYLKNMELPVPVTLEEESSVAAIDDTAAVA